MTKSDLPRFFFFVSHWIDVEHLLPVAYKLAESGIGKPIAVMSDFLYVFNGDYRLKFLRDEYGIQTVSAFGLHPTFPPVAWLTAMLSHPIWHGFLRRQRLFSLRTLREIYHRE